MPIPPTIAEPFDHAVESAIRHKRWMASNHLRFAKLFAWTFVGFCAGGIFFAEKIGALAYGMAWGTCALLVVALLNSSRSVSGEADRLEVYAADRSAEGRERVLKELNLPQDEGATTGLSAFREAILNPITR